MCTHFTYKLCRFQRKPTVRACICIYACMYEGVSKSFQTGLLEWELQMVKLSATRFSCIVILWVSLVSFAAITLRVVSQRVFIDVISLWLSPETFGYTLVRTYYVWMYVCTLHTYIYYIYHSAYRHYFPSVSFNTKPSYNMEKHRSPQTRPNWGS
jgi:hypothetical protein